MAIASVGIEEFSTWAVDQIDYKEWNKECSALSWRPRARCCRVVVAANATIDTPDVVFEKFDNRKNHTCGITRRVNVRSHEPAGK
jgi:hypothetical protein